MNCDQVISQLNDMRNKGDLAAADDLLRRFTDESGSKPDQFWRLNVMVCFCQDIGEFDAAVEYATRLVTLDSEDPHAHFTLAQSLAFAGRGEESLSALDQSELVGKAELTALDLYIHSTLRALCFLMLGNLPEAINTARSIPKGAKPEDIDAGAGSHRKLVLGALLLLTGNNKEGTRLIAEACEAVPKDSLGSKGLAHYLTMILRCLSANAVSITRDANIPGPQPQ